MMSDYVKFAIFGALGLVVLILMVCLSCMYFVYQWVVNRWRMRSRVQMADVVDDLEQRDTNPSILTLRGSRSSTAALRMASLGSSGTGSLEPTSP